MAPFKRTADAVWNGDLRAGSGQITTRSGVLKDVSYSFGTRFGDTPGTNPEELVAAAHAACYSMAFADTLASRGYRPECIETHAVCTVSSQEGGGFRITRMHLDVRGRVADIDQATFERVAREAEQGCPVSNALRGGPEIELEATLL